MPSEISWGSIHMPTIGLGTLGNRGERGRALIEAGLSEGYRHIDTGQYYGNEDVVGQAIAASAVDRDDIWLTTKFLHPKAPAATDLRARLDLSLRQLGVDHVDAMMLHWPPHLDSLEAVLNALNQFRDDGKARTIGVCNFPSEMLRAALAICPDLKLVQVEYHPYLDQRKLLEVIREHDLALVAHSPLALGKVLDDEVIQRVADDHGRSPAQIALRWLVQQSHVAAIPGGSPDHIGHLRENLAVHDFDLTALEMESIGSLARGLRVVDPPHAPTWDI